MSQVPATVRRKALFSVVILVFSLTAADLCNAQSTIHVPSDQPTIQAAINAANNGDTVLVAPGTYAENINFNGKAITVTSSNGPSVTIIDGGALGSVVTFTSGETASSTLSGFTIRNGYQNGFWGAGIFISGASPTITGNTITGNHAAVGIGIYVGGGSPLIKNNTITANNQAGAGDGGGGGGGILVSGNSSTPATPQIIGNTITNNSVAAGGNGGGISVDYFSSPLIQGNLIQGNTAYNDGGGISLQSYDSPVVIQNIIVNNSSLGGGSGAGIWVSPSSALTLINNTIAGNTAFDGTSGIFVTGFGQYATFTNNIIVAASGQTAVTCNSIYSSISPFFSYNDAFSATGQPWAGICDTTSNPGNISADPTFVNASSDFHLKSGSPAIDAGNNNAPNLPQTDFDGNPRIADGNGDGVSVIDLGAHEFPAPPAPIASLSPSALSFPSQPVGTSSQTQVVTLTNTGNANLSITSITATGTFSETNNCPPTLAPSSGCTIDVVFSPAARGASGGTLTASDNAAGSPQTVNLNGTGIAPVATLTPSSLAFGNQFVGTTTAAQTIVLANTGDATLNVSSISASGDFAQTNTCGATLAPNANCNINVTFAPSATGSRFGTLSVSDDAFGGSPQTASLSGTGTAPAVSFSPATFSSFGNQRVNTTSPAQTMAMTNTGSAPLSITSITVTAGFSETNNCGTSLAVNASCSVSVTFMPTAQGSVTGTLTINSNLPGPAPSFALSGTGTASVATLSATSLTFASQIVGTSSAAQLVTLTNSGTASLNVSSISASGDFSQANNCPASLAPGANCTVSVRFTPTASGNRTGTLSIADDALGGSPQTVSLNGTGYTVNPAFNMASLQFASQRVGTTSAAQNVTLTNSGSGPLSISGFVMAGDFAQTNNCPASLAAGGSCTISVTFQPTARGTRSGALTLSSNFPGTPPSLSLSGTGIAPVASLLPASLTFADHVVSTTSSQQNVTLSNTGDATLDISSITASGDFAQTNNCVATLSPGAHCTVSVKFTPTAPGARVGTLTVTDDAFNGSPQSTSLTGTGVDFSLSVSPSSLTVTHQNSVSATVTVTALGDPFNSSVNLACSAGLPKGANCSFSPGGVTPGSSSATSTMKISTNGSTPPGSYIITVRGTSGSIQHTTTVTLQVN